MDRELRYTYVNPTAERLMGHPAEQLLGRGLLEVFPEVRELEVHRACVRVLASGTPEANEQFFPRQQRWYRNHLYPTSDGLAVFFEDITAAKRMEALLGEERMRYRAVFEQAGAGVVERRLDDGRVLAANARYLQILGRTEAEVIGSPLGAFAHPDDRTGEQRRFAALRAGAENLAPTEKRFLRPDGSVVWISLTSSVVRPGGNRPPYLITILQDVTERQRAVEALARSEQRLATYSRELARAVEAERTRIAREIHDELGQLLTGLKLDVAWLARRLPPATSTTGTGTSAVAERIEDIQVQLDETIHSMRRIATELRPAALDELGLGPALRAHVAEFVRRAGLSADIRIDDVDVGADGATALFRIAQEALTNVARHASASHVQVTLAAEAGHAVLEVADDGRGAPLEAGGETAAERIGHGLVGIFERARLAGGEASVVSGPGHGTAVRARVPRAAPRRDPELEQRA
jgi:PAS domain S-box-containing protein